MEIWRDDLYEERGFSSIRVYANNRFGFIKQRTYQLIRYARVVEILEDEDHSKPQNEAQARPLYRLLGDQEDELVEVWKAVTDSHSLSELTRDKVYRAVHDTLSDDTEDESSVTEDIGLALPPGTADDLGLSGTDYRNKRVVPWAGLGNDDLEEIISETEPETEAPESTSDEPVIGAKAWYPLKRLGVPQRIYLDEPDEEESSLQFRPDLVQQLQEARVPSHASKLRKERSDTLACPQVDLLSDTVPDALTEEVLDRSGDTDWSPIFWSKCYENWVDYDLPDEAWIGAHTDRDNLEETAEVFESADDTEVKWVLYDLSGKDRDEGLPEIDLSVLDWVVLDTPGGSGVQLPLHQFENILRSTQGHDITTAVRDPFMTSAKARPST